MLGLEPGLAALVIIRPTPISITLSRSNADCSAWYEGV
jgi:hypothetical protein